ncbi:glycoside hydrolase family 125 protein [Ruania suaedae]|uniref:glycoside hydrolase family 125 protein n=1 Tax=Ruania suaedae TaxID=2897774 RepID=UPI001E2B07D8|nr:glycoside hydrolase family 125 protein [Ruania suaedae]UFU03592.1 glycoside hydrolase family 125 protein [Ruania suaedae]
MTAPVRTLDPVPPPIAQAIAAHVAPVTDALGRQVGERVLAALHRTLRETITIDGDGVFVITGDIPAMWLRDSTTQLLPYLRMVGGCAPLADLVAGVLQRQFRQLDHDPYANAFNRTASGAHYEPADLNDDPWVWEQKYEVDSLAFPLQLAHRFWRLTGRTDHLDERARRVAATVMDQLTREQRHPELSPYRFERPGAIATETLPDGGLGSPVGYTGMTWSGFRPSDDACTFGYNVPANLTAAQALLGFAEVAEEVWSEAALAARARSLAGELTAGVAEHGTVEHPRHGRVYAYEVDGLGGVLLMDDANMPSLLSLPMLAPDVLDPQIYRATRALVLSTDNPWYFAGAAGAGIGSPHTGPDRIWPIALAVQGLTSTDPAEQRELLELIVRTDAGTGHVHESFHRDDPAVFSRPWFSWADSMFCELALQIAADA